MFDIVLNHLLCYFTWCDTKITPCPKMLSPISFSEFGKKLKEFSWTSSFDSPHNFTWSHIGWGGYKYMHMVSTDDPLLYLYFEKVTGLFDEVSCFIAHITFEYRVSVFCYKNKMIFYFENGMATISILHKWILCSFYSSIAFWQLEINLSVFKTEVLTFLGTNKYRLYSDRASSERAKKTCQVVVRSITQSEQSRIYMVLVTRYTGIVWRCMWNEIYKRPICQMERHTTDS